jgi:hypothetical protein
MARDHLGSGNVYLYRYNLAIIHQGPHCSKINVTEHFNVDNYGSFIRLHHESLYFWNNP